MSKKSKSAKAAASKKNTQIVANVEPATQSEAAVVVETAEGVETIETATSVDAVEEVEVVEATETETPEEVAGPAETTETEAPAESSEQAETTEVVAAGATAETGEEETPVATISLAPFVSVSRKLPLSLIDPSPFNKERFISEAGLQELAGSIRQDGVLTEILVRPTADGRYMIVFGERRFRASKLAGLDEIPAKIMDLTDEQAEKAAITENIQRENYSAAEECRIFHYLTKIRRMSVERICEEYGKSESYVRVRLNLINLIPEVSEMLNNKEISLEMAKEFGNYSQEIQKEVYTRHFCTNSSLYCWRGITAKEFAKKLYDQYMTKLDNYHFDKTQCNTCGHNTFNQVLFTDCGDCAGCQNHACLQAKNEAYLIARSLELQTKDPRLHIAVTEHTSPNVIARLTEMGHDIVQIEDMYYLDAEPEMPEMPKAEDFEDPDDFQFELDSYNEEMEEFKQECQTLEFSVSEGKHNKFAVISKTTVDIYYEEIDEVIDEDSAAEDEDEAGGDTRAVEGETPRIPAYVAPKPEPAKSLKDKDARNLEIRYEHVTTELKKVLRNVKPEEFPTTAISPREEQFFYYVLLHNITPEHKVMLGFSKWETSSSAMESFAGNITPEQKTMLFRMVIMKFCDNMYEYRCKPESPDVKLISEFADMHFHEQSQPIQDRYKAVYEKHHKNLAVRIEAIEKEAALLELQFMAENGELRRLPDDTVLNPFTGETFDAERIATALPDVEIPELAVEEPLESDSPEVMPEEPQPVYEPIDEPDWHELIPDEDEAPTAKGKKAKGKKMRLTADSPKKGKEDKEEKIAA